MLPALFTTLLLLSPPEAAPPPEPPLPPIAPLIADLASSAPDPRPRIALESLISRSDSALPSLTAALNSPDLRQRQLAAAALRAFDGFMPDGYELRPGDRISTPRLSIPISDALIRVTIEGLKHDALPGVLASDREYGERPIVFNAICGTRFLIKHIDKAEPQVIEAVKSPDLQQRFCAAVILAFAHRTTHAETICAILIPHLRDNSIPCDALWAACALYRLGPAADLHLQAAALKPIDKQQRELLALMLLDIRQPLKNPAGYGPRAAGKLTTLDLDGAMDPLIAFNQNALRMDWGSSMTPTNRDTPRPPPAPQTNIFLNPKSEK